MINLASLRQYGEAELLSMLDGAGLLDDFNEDMLICASCGVHLNSENIGVVVYDGSRRGFRKGLASCRDDECVDELVGGHVPSVFEKSNTKIGPGVCI